MNLQENIQRIREMMGIDNSRVTFNIQKLVDDGIIFVTEPGDGEGGVAKPNWEGDCSVITLVNLTDEELEKRIQEWNPEIMIVGSDYKNKLVIGSHLVNEVLFFDRIDNYSSTKIIEMVL